MANHIWHTYGSVMGYKRCLNGNIIYRNLLLLGMFHCCSEQITGGDFAQQTWPLGAPACTKLCVVVPEIPTRIEFLDLMKKQNYWVCLEIRTPKPSG